MGKQIIDLIGELVSISGNSTVDSIIFAIIGTISFLVAFGIVGWIFDAIGIYDSDLMSGAHWLIRVLVFAGLTWLGVKIAQLIKWLFRFQWWVYVIAGVIFVGIIILIYYIKSRISENDTYSTPTIEAPKIETTVQHKENKEFTLSWFEEIVCEAMSLYALQYASNAWNRCSLAQYMPLFGQNHETYLTQELAKDSTIEFSQCDTIEKLLEYEKKEFPESQRESHRVERNFVYRAISSNPQDFRSVIDYTKYMNNNGITINFEKWIHDDNSNFLKELRKIQPVKIESSIIV